MDKNLRPIWFENPEDMPAGTSVAAVVVNHATPCATGENRGGPTVSGRGSTLREPPPEAPHSRQKEPGPMRRFMDCRAVVAPQGRATVSSSFDGMRGSVGRPHDSGVTVFRPRGGGAACLPPRARHTLAPAAARGRIQRTCTRAFGTSPNISGA